MNGEELRPVMDPEEVPDEYQAAKKRYYKNLRKKLREIRSASDINTTKGTKSET